MLSFYAYSCEQIHTGSLKRYFCFNRLPYILRSVGKRANIKKINYRFKASAVKYEYSNYTPIWVFAIICRSTFKGVSHNNIVAQFKTLKYNCSHG